MKKLSTLVPIILCFLALIFLTVSSCDKMDDIQRKFAEREEQVYLGKVDSIQSFPGFGRARLTWYIDADPRIDQTIIYWNMRQDSVVKEFKRTIAGVVKDSITLDSLSEGTTLFEFRNVNDQGETSLYSSASVSVWGPEFADGLHARKLTGSDFSYAASSYKLSLSPAIPGDGVVYSQIIYTNAHGEEKTVRIERDSNNVKLDDFPDGGELRFRTVFFPPQGIDTVYNDYEIANAPTAVFEKGVKMSLKGDMLSNYFAREDSLYEWNATGDLSVYAINTDGSVNPTDTFSSIVPRDTYRDFFFYDDDKFIGISAGNAVSMYQITDDNLVFVKTPSGANTFGSSFNYPEFIPARGFFFTVTAGTGDLRTWFANDNATWGSPNGATVGTGFTQYDPLILFNHQTLLGVDSDGYLWSIPISASGDIATKSRIGSGWKRFKKMVSIGTKLLCMEENGDFYIFDNFNTTDKFWIVDQ